MAPDFKVLDIEPIATDLKFTESPRYREGFLYISDMIGKMIWKIDVEKKTKEPWLQVPEQPNGTGFLSDGTFIIGSMFDGKLMAVRDMNKPKMELYKDLNPLMKGYCGDMVIDAQDNIYIDDVGARLHHGESFKPGRVIMVRPDKEMFSVCENIAFANGICIDSSASKLFLAESHDCCVTLFDIKPDGKLTNRRTWLNNFDVIQFDIAGDGVETPKTDGMTIDAEDAIWVSFFASGAFLRITQDGLITHRINVDGEATTCMLGGKDGKDLFISSNHMPRGKNENTYENMNKGLSVGTVYRARVEVGKGKGRP